MKTIEHHKSQSLNGQFSFALLLRRRIPDFFSIEERIVRDGARDLSPFIGSTSCGWSMTNDHQRQLSLILRKTCVLKT
jgi:hypothetical protein